MMKGALNNQQNQAKYYDRHSRPLKDLYIGEKVNMLDNKTLQPAVVMNRCEKPRNFIVKTENGKKLTRNRQHLHQTADRNETDDTILISDGKEENYTEQEVNIKPEEVEISLRDEVNVPHPDNLSNEVTTRSGQVSRRPTQYNDYV